MIHALLMLHGKGILGRHKFQKKRLSISSAAGLGIDVSGIESIYLSVWEDIIL